MAAPTFVAEYEASQAWDDATEPKTVSVTTAVGDVLVVASGSANGSTQPLELPTGGTGTYANQIAQGNESDESYARIDTAVTGVTAQTYTLSQNDAGTGTDFWGFTALRFSASDGIGAAVGADSPSGTATVSITTTQDNSAIAVIVTDWGATDGTSRTWATVNSITPTEGNGYELVYFRDSDQYAVYVAYYPDAGAAGAKTVGVSSPGSLAYSIAAVEIRGAADPGFPTIPTVADGRLLVANQLNTTAARTFPSLTGLTKEAGDLLIAICVAYQTSTGTNAAYSSWGAGFTEFHDSATSTTMAIGLAYKWSDGTETGTFTVTQAGTITGDASLILMSIAGAHATTPPEAGSRVSGTASAADPGSFNPSGWDVEKTLWAALAGSGMTSGTGSWSATGTTAPAGFTGRVDTNASDTSTIGDTEAAIAFRLLEAAALDVGTAGVDTSNARNAAVVIAVRPAPSSEEYSGGSTAAVTAAATGAGRKAADQGTTAAVTVSSTAAGRKRADQGTTATVTVTATGAGSAGAEIHAGGATATVTVSSTAAGRKRADQGTTPAVTVSSTAAGRKRADQGTTSAVTVTATGAGVHHGTGAATALVTVTATGVGSAGEIHAHGSTALVLVHASGYGWHREPDVSEWVIWMRRHRLYKRAHHAIRPHIRPHL